MVKSIIDTYYKYIKNYDEIINNYELQEKLYSEQINVLTEKIKDYVEIEIEYMTEQQIKEFNDLKKKRKTINNK